MRPPRADVTVPPCSSIDPRAGVDVAKFREEYCAWGMALAHYAEFRVTMPCALRVRGLGGGLVAPFTKSDMANLLDLGTYSGQLNNLVIDSFMRSIMPDVFDAARQIRAGKNPPAAVFMPCTFSAKYKDGLRNTVEGYVLDEIGRCEVPRGVLRVGHGACALRGVSCYHAVRSPRPWTRRWAGCTFHEDRHGQPPVRRSGVLLICDFLNQC